MYFLTILAICMVFLGIAGLFFILIARKGRKLRTMRRLPSEADRATVQSPDGKKFEVKSQTQFYFGKHPECQVVLPQTSQDYVVCIFHHRKRFAFQTLSSDRGIHVNGEEQMAG